MSRRGRRTLEKACTVLFSVLVVFISLMQVPALKEPETCVNAALIITGAYSWYVLLFWANFIHPMIKEG